MDEQTDHKPPSRRRWVTAGCLLLLLVACLAGAGVLLLNRLSSPGETAEAGPAAAAATTPVEPDATTEAEPTAVITSTAAYSGRIAFVDPQGRLGTVSPGGGEERLLTEVGAVYLFPAWSPDGEHLAAVGQSADGPGVFAVGDTEGADVTPLYVNRAGAPIYLYWSPAGGTVSFIANHERGLGLYLAAADGAEEPRLLATGAPLYWQWRSSGDEVFIHTGANARTARLAFIGVDGGAPGENLARPGYFQAPGISADGRYLAWAEVDAAGERWLVVRAEEEGEGERLPHRGAIAMSWSPDSQSSHLAFISPAGAEERPLLAYHGPLRLLDATSGEIEVLSPQSVLAFFWSPDGSRIAYLTLTGRDEGMQAASEAWGALPRRGKGAAQHEDLQLTLWVADVASGQSTRLLTFRPTRMYLTQFLPFFDQYALSHRVWALGGDALVLPIAGDSPDPDGIYVVPVSGANARRVADGNMAFWSATP